MNIAVLTNEYPPHVYGGAGVHVEYLTRELAALDDGEHTVRVLCFGDQQDIRGNLQVQGVRPPVELPSRDPRHSKLFSTLLQDLVMAGTLADVDIVHCHTWYTHFAGCLTKQLQNVPLVSDHTFARAAPALESGAAWNSLRCVQLGRARGVPISRRSDRGVGVDEARCA